MTRSECDQSIQESLCRQKGELLKKYACFNGYEYYKGVCGPTKISDHPDFDKYVSKDELSMLIKREVETRDNLPIEQHPDYPKLKAYFRDLLYRKIIEIQRQNRLPLPIEQHPDYTRLMDEYACKIDGKYVSCQINKDKIKNMIERSIREREREREKEDERTRWTPCPELKIEHDTSIPIEGCNPFDQGDMRWI